MATCNVIIILSGAMKNDEFLSCKKYCESSFKKCVTINNKLSRNKFFYNPAVPQSVYRFKCSGYIISQIHVITGKFTFCFLHVHVHEYMH